MLCPPREDVEGRSTVAEKVDSREVVPRSRALEESVRCQDDAIKEAASKLKRAGIESLSSLF
jgi:hypothetical protein